MISPPLPPLLFLLLPLCLLLFLLLYVYTHTFFFSFFLYAKVFPLFFQRTTIFSQHFPTLLWLILEKNCHRPSLSFLSSPSRSICTLQTCFLFSRRVLLCSHSSLLLPLITLGTMPRSLQDFFSPICAWPSIDGSCRMQGCFFGVLFPLIQLGAYTPNLCISWRPTAPTVPVSSTLPACAVCQSSIRAR